MPKRVRIISDGSPPGTRVFLGEDEITDSVMSIEWSLASRDRLASVSLRFLAPDAELAGETEEGGDHDLT